MIDFKGDIEELFLKLGYIKSNGAYSHPDTKVLFIGAYIEFYNPSKNS